MSNIPRFTGPIQHADLDIGSRARAVVAAKIAGAVNALYERIQGTPAPGSNAFLVRPHNHTEIGHTLARGMGFCFDSGENNQWTITLTTTSDYYRAIGNGSATLADDGTDVYLHTIPNIRMYCTPNVDGANNAEGSGTACVLRVRAFIIPSANATCRFRNRTTGTVGATFAVTSAGGWYSASIPVRGGVENEIDLEASCAALPCTVRVYSLVIAEVRHYSQPISLGSNALTSAARP